jgi:hypothetical protein
MDTSQLISEINMEYARIMNKIEYDLRPSARVKPAVEALAVDIALTIDRRENAT